MLPFVRYSDYCTPVDKSRPRRWRVAALEDEDMPANMDMGRSEKATLVMLEWTRLCTFIADFASTTVGRKSILSLEVSSDSMSILCNLLLRLVGRSVMHEDSKQPMFQLEAECKAAYCIRRASLPD